MKPYKCLLCKKRNTEDQKPFCPYCFKHADIFAKIKVFREAKLHNDYNFYKRRERRAKRYYSTLLRDKFGDAEGYDTNE